MKLKILHHPRNISYFAYPGSDTPSRPSSHFRALDRPPYPDPQSSEEWLYVVKWARDTGRGRSRHKDRCKEDKSPDRQRYPSEPRHRQWGGGGRGGSQCFLTFGWEPSAMVDREKLSLWSSEGVRNLLVRTEERRENVSETITATSDRSFTGQALCHGCALICCTTKKNLPFKPWSNPFLSPRVFITHFKALI